MSAEIIAFRKREKPKDKPATPPSSRRLEALDALRGLCVAGLIVMTGLAAPEAGAHGFSLNNLISAGYLLCIGMAIPLSLAARAVRQSRGQLVLHIGLRTVILVALGLVLSNAPGTDLAHLRLDGPLLYAGLCYGVAAIFCLTFGRKSDADFTLRVWPVVALLAGVLAVPAGLELAGWPGAARQMGFDPVELMKGLGALAVLLLGVVAALLVRKHGLRSVAVGLAFLGVLLFVAGSSLAGMLPVDGDLWTPAFAIMAGGVALIVFAIVAIAGEIPGVKSVTYPLRVFGGNPLLAFVAATLVAWVSPQIWPQIGQMASLYAVALLPVIGLPLWGLYRKRIYLTP